MEKYEKIYRDYLEHAEERHILNKKKIRITLRLYILIPLLFLLLSFFRTEAKLTFLVLWIVSLFTLSVYMIYIEYTDHHLMERVERYKKLTEEE